MSTAKKTKKWDPDSPAWQTAANRLARSFAPTVYPCGDCNGPVISGYCCDHCGSNDPRAKRGTR